MRRTDNQVLLYTVKVYWEFVQGKRKPKVRDTEIKKAFRSEARAFAAVGGLHGQLNLQMADDEKRARLAEKHNEANSFRVEKEDIRVSPDQMHGSYVEIDGQKVKLCNY